MGRDRSGGSRYVYAVQVNYHDHQSNMYGRIPGLRHRYAVEGSLDGQDWVTLVDRRNNYKDVPNDYVQVDNPARVRYVRYKNIEVPTPHLAISDLRVFGIGEGKKPATVKNFKVVRQADRRDAMITWDAVKNSQGYNIRWGIAPDKLYNSWLLYGKNELLLKSLSTDQPYYFTIEAFNENGVSEATKYRKPNNLPVSFQMYFVEIGQSVSTKYIQYSIIYLLTGIYLDLL